MRACVLSRYTSRLSVAPHLSRNLTPSRSVACEANKAKKGGKKGNKKGGSLLGDLANAPKIQPWQTTEVIMQHLLMIESYWRAAGKPLVKADIENIADVLYEAPFAIIAHNRFAPNVKDEDAVYTYANKAALEAFQADSYGDLVGMLSSKCIEGLEETELENREKYLTTILPDSYAGAAAEQEEAVAEEEVEGDSRRVAGADSELRTSAAGGRRIGLKGRIFEIEATLWNIVSPTGVVMGQAAWFDSYKLEDGTVVTFDADGDAPTEASPEALAEAKAAVEAQADVVRSLKRQEGLSNKSPEVQEAVEELLAWKERLQALQAVAVAAAPAEAGAEAGAEV
eukprot:jgi/Ulvmu1/2367/UM013_0215.1